MPWEYFSLKYGDERSKDSAIPYFTSPHVWLFLIPITISYSYFSIVTIFPNYFIEQFGDNATWDLLLINSNYIARIILSAIISLFFIVDIILAIKYHRLDKKRQGMYEGYCKKLRELHEENERKNRCQLEE